MQIRASAGETCPAWADWPVKWRHWNGQGERRALTGPLSPLPARTFQVPSLDNALMQAPPSADPAFIEGLDRGSSSLVRHSTFQGSPLIWNPDGLHPLEVGTPSSITSDPLGVGVIPKQG